MSSTDNKNLEDNQPCPIFRKDYTPPSYLIDTVYLEFDILPNKTIVTSELNIRKNPSVNITKNLELNGEETELISLSIDGTELNEDEYKLTKDKLIISNLSDSFTIKLKNSIKPHKNTSLDGLYKSGSMYCTQCEAEGFRKITYFLDRPDILSNFKVKITADKTEFPILLSNGNCLDKGDIEDNRHWVLWEDPTKKPSYLFALVAGDLALHKDSFTTMSGKEIDLLIYVEHENIDKTQHAMESLKKAMKWDEEVYGLEYDLDNYMIVAVNDFNMGAMENKGLNIFNSKYVLAKPETATDTDYENIENVIAHEYFHNWTGNRITCRDWFQLSLKEGLTVFRDQQFTADMTSESVKRINDVRVLRSHQFPEDSGPMAHPVRPDSYIEMNNFYTVTVYNKGAEIIRMYKTILGEEGYYKGIKLYFERHDGQAVTCQDFLNAMSDANKESESSDLSQFALWYSQLGTPIVDAEGNYDSEKKSYTITFKQTPPPQPEKKVKPFHIPVRFALLDSNGSEITLNTENSSCLVNEDVINIRNTEEQVTFKNVKEKPIPSILRGFSAPIKLNYEYSDEELTFLMSNDSDDFCRWEAGQLLITRVLTKFVNEIHNKKFPSPDENIINAFRNCLDDNSLDKSFCSLILTLPSESYLLEVIENDDIDAIFKAREFLRETIAESLSDKLLEIYNDNIGCKPYKIDPIEIGKRNLKNLCLGYLTSLERQENIDICVNQFHNSDNMTDVISALTMLSHTNCSEREQAISDFYNKWKNDPLVVDKWFSIQSQSKRENTLNEVIRLLEHPAFQISNPNKVRALIGSFAQNNLRHFHNISGKGYKFIADQVIELNAINPQIAARIVSSLITWKKFDHARQVAMKNELKRIIETPDLSKNVYEIASKALN